MIASCRLSSVAFFSEVKQFVVGTSGIQIGKFSGEYLQDDIPAKQNVLRYFAAGFGFVVRIELFCVNARRRDRNPFAFSYAANCKEIILIGSVKGSFAFIQLGKIFGRHCCRGVKLWGAEFGSSPFLIFSISSSTSSSSALINSFSSRSNSSSSAVGAAGAAGWVGCGAGDGSNINKVIAVE